MSSNTNTLFSSKTLEELLAIATTAEATAKAAREELHTRDEMRRLAQTSELICSCDTIPDDHLRVTTTADMLSLTLSAARSITRCSSSVYTGGWDDVKIFWLPSGAAFRLHEHDGYERIEELPPGVHIA